MMNAEETWCAKTAKPPEISGDGIHNELSLDETTPGTWHNVLATTSTTPHHERGGIFLPKS